MNCPYCHQEGYNVGWGKNQLTVEQIKRLIPIIEKYEIYSIKLTGGEPLLHPDITEIVRILASIPTVTDISLTTNGLLLADLAKDLKKAGLQRVNVGCDSLYQPNVKNLGKIKNSLRVAKEVGFSPIKLNMVLLKGINENEVWSMIDFAREEGFILQLIELINYHNEFYKKYHVDLRPIEAELAEKAEAIITRDVQARKQYVLKNNAIVEIVHPMHNPDFCANCHTMRVTNDFQFQPCLMRTDNLVPIGDDIERALLKAMENRRPFFVRKKSIDG